MNFIDDEDNENSEQNDGNGREQDRRSVFAAVKKKIEVEPKISTGIFFARKRSNRRSKRKSSRVGLKRNLTETKFLSLSDSQINYKDFRENEQTNGSSEFINRNGTLNFSVVLAALHAIICKDDQLKICELVMNNLDLLLGLAVISSSEEDQQKRKWFQFEKNQTNKIEIVEQWFNYVDNKDDEKYQIAMDIVLRRDDKRPKSTISFFSLCFTESSNDWVVRTVNLTCEHSSSISSEAKSD